MSYNGVSRIVQRFVADHIDSVVQLETLLLLHACPDRAFHPHDVGEALRINVASAAEQLATMAASGLLTRSGDDQSPAYRYAPRDPALDDAVQHLVQAYTDRRVTVISLIFAKPNRRLETFADAFRLREEESNDR